MNALLVIGTPTLTDGDTGLQEWLESEGWTVTIKNDDEDTGQDWPIVILAPSVAHQRIGEKYYGGADPVLMLDRGVWKAWGMAQDSEFSSVGTGIVITHPDLAGSVFGDAVFCLEPTTVYTAAGLSADAIPFAMVPEQEGISGCCGFAYEDGSVTYSTTAFGRRAGLGLSDEAFAAGLTEDGQAILRGVIDWCAGITHPQTVRADFVEMGILAYDVGDSQSGWGVRIA